MSLKSAFTMPTTDREWQKWCRDSGDTRFITGTGDPNGVQTGNRGQFFLRDDTGDIYKKTTNNADTGWVAL